MTNVTERQKNILERLITEHIKIALPISSSFLKQKCHLPVSSATIRLDFAELSKAGFLEKHYISGGSVPTDKGYRFFVDNLFEKEDFAGEEEKILKEFQSIFREIKKINDTFRFSHEIAKNIASFSSNLGVSYFEDFDIFWKEGWEEVVRAPEFHNLEYLKKFTELINDLEENIQKISLNEKDKKVKVYIGKESPFKRKEFSIVLGKSLAPKNQAIFAIVGPKRMNFKRNISLIEGLIKTIE